MAEKISKKEKIGLREIKNAHIVKRSRIDNRFKIDNTNIEVFDYIKALMDSVNSRYGSLNFLDTSTDEFQNDRKEIDKVLNNQNYITEDNFIIEKLDEVESILNGRIKKLGGYLKEKITQKVIDNLIIAENLNQGLKKLQKLRQKRKSEVSEQIGKSDKSQPVENMQIADSIDKKENNELNNPSISDVLKATSDKSEIKNIAKSSKISKKEEIVIYGEKDHKSAFSFYGYNSDSQQYEYKQTEEVVKGLNEDLNTDKEIYEGLKKEVADTLNADISTSIPEDNRQVVTKNQADCSLETIAELSIKMNRKVKYIKSRIAYYEENLRWAETIIKHSRIKKQADFELVEMYKKCLEESENALAEIMEQGKQLDKKLAEVRKYRSENKEALKDNNLEYLMGHFFSIQNRFCNEKRTNQNAVSRQIGNELLEETYANLKELLNNQSQKADDNSVKKVDIAVLLADEDILKKDKVISLWGGYDKAKIAEIENNPQAILSILEAIISGVYDGRKLTNDEKEKLSKIIGSVGNYKHELKIEKLRSAKNKDKTNEESEPQPLQN